VEAEVGNLLDILFKWTFKFMSCMSCRKIVEINHFYYFYYFIYNATVNNLWLNGRSVAQDLCSQFFSLFMGVWFIPNVFSDLVSNSFGHSQIQKSYHRAKHPANPKKFSS
jgi:hypothetical protein